MRRWEGRELPAAYSQPPSVVLAEVDIVDVVTIELAHGVDDRCCAWRGDSPLDYLLSIPLSRGEFHLASPFPEASVEPSILARLEPWRVGALQHGGGCVPVRARFAWPEGCTPAACPYTYRLR